MPEPTGGENHPFAEIIDLFREATPEATPETDAAADEPTPAAPIAPAPRSHSDAAAAVLAAVEPVPVQPTPPVARTPKKAAAHAPTRRRGGAMLLPVALLALATGATAAVMHEQDARNNDAAPGRTPLGVPTTLPSGTASATVTPPGKAAAEEYSRALDRLAAVGAGEDLAATVRRLRGSTADLDAAKGALARAEAAHVDALFTLGTLDATSSSGLISYSRLATGATKAAGAVARAAHGSADVPDPSVATSNVVALASSRVADGLDAQLDRLAKAAAEARLTAQLRIVASQAEALVPAATRVAQTSGDDASADAQALRALAGLHIIDADHLGSWAALRAPLQQALTAAGVTAASSDVEAISAMVSSAQRKIAAWEAKTGAPVVSSGPSGETPAQIKKAQKAAAQAVSSYAASANELVGRYAQDIATLPQVSPGQEPSFELASRYNATSHLFDALTAQVNTLRPPAGMADAQQALASLVARGRTAATAGQAMAVSAENCDPAARVCVLGAMREWPAYKRAVAALGSSGGVRGTIATSARTAKAAAASGEAGTAGLGSTTSSTAPPKPVV